MKILVLCDQGNNRSVTIAHQLKYWGHDILTAGLETNGVITIMMLAEWADRIIFTDKHQQLPAHIIGYEHITQLWDVGPDVYPRPLNKDLLRKVKQLMEEHTNEYHPTTKLD